MCVTVSQAAEDDTNTHNKEQFVSLTVADSPVAPIDLDIFPRTWYPSLDVFPAAFISFSATSWQSMLSLMPVEETKMWSFGKKRRKKIDIYGISLFWAQLLCLVLILTAWK